MTPLASARAEQPRFVMIGIASDISITIGPNHGGTTVRRASIS